MNSPGHPWFRSKEQVGSHPETPELHLTVVTSDFRSSDIGVSGTKRCSEAKASSEINKKPIIHEGYQLN